MIDGLKTSDYVGDDIEVKDDLIVADEVSGAAMDVYASGITATAATITTLSGTNLVATTDVKANGKSLSAVGTGSPSSTWGQLIQSDITATGAGSSLWLVFPTTFGSAPASFNCSDVENANKWVFAFAGSLNAGSAFILSEEASADISWVAVGAEA